MSDFPQRPKPWRWEVSSSGETYAVLDANGNVLFTILDEHLDREQDLEHIVECVNEHEQLKTRVQELEREIGRLQPQQTTYEEQYKQVGENLRDKIQPSRER
jgi:uncharacterized protein YhaN